jgi:predicted negative regulator of RcsB-dependent stress response
MNPQEAPPPSRTLEFLAWVEVNKQRLLQAVGVLLAAGLVVYAWQHFRGEAEKRASDALLMLQRSADTTGAKPDSARFLTLASSHSGTAAGRRALLLGAGELFSEKKFDLARARFEEVLAGDAADDLAPTAMMGIAASIEATGKLDDAMRAYERVVSTFATEPESVQAQLAMALIHEAKKEDERALRIYDEVLRSQRQSVWKMEANMRRDLLVTRSPQLAPTNPFAPIRIVAPPAGTNAPTAATNPPVPPAKTAPPVKK